MVQMTVEEMFQGLQLQHQQLIAQNQQLSAQVAAMGQRQQQEEVALLKVELAATRSELAAKIEAVKAELAATRCELTAKVEVAEVRMEASSSQLCTAVDRAVAAECKLKAAETKLAALQQEATIVKEELQLAKEKLKVAEDKAAAVKEEATIAKEEASKAKEESTRLKKEATKANKEATRAKKEATSSNEEATRTKAELASARNEAASAKRSVELIKLKQQPSIKPILDFAKIPKPERAEEIFFPGYVNPAIPYDHIGSYKRKFHKAANFHLLQLEEWCINNNITDDDTKKLVLQKGLRELHQADEVKGWRKVSLVDLNFTSSDLNYYRECFATMFKD